MLIGEKLVLMYKWDAGRALKLIEDEKVQNIVGVPTNTYDLATGMLEKTVQVHWNRKIEKIGILKVSKVIKLLGQ